MKKDRNGFTLIEMLVVITIVIALGITIGVSMNKLSQNTKNANNESIIKEILVATQTYCKLSSSNCSNDIQLSTLISSGTLDEDIFTKNNPAKSGNVKFNGTDIVKLIINTSTKEEDFVYTCNENHKYKLSTIDNCTKNGKCSWGEC